MRDDLVDCRQQLAERLLEGCRLLVRRFDGQCVAYLQVQLQQVSSALQIVDSHAVRAHAVLRGQHPYACQDPFVV